MTLIKSISGIRGTIGGVPGDNLTPFDIVKFTIGYAQWLAEDNCNKDKLVVVVGRDARISGEMVSSLIHGALMGCGIDVIDVGLCTTPGVELAVTARGADGGIIITASHNPKQWNALKLLNGKGEFLNDIEGKKVLSLAERSDSIFPGVDNLGAIIERASFDDEHIDMVLALPLVDVDAIKSKKFKVIVDAINSVGGIAIPRLLERMGVDVECINGEPTGEFAHNPEPLAENLTQIMEFMRKGGADLGIVVDPDVDRLAFISENGDMFGEEYTLVAVADYVLSQTPGNTVSNLSSTRALSDITKAHGAEYFAAAVGEVNVVSKMKEVGAIIGGEGNGGVIYPELHYGRDALVGVALFLTLLAKSNKSASELRKEYPEYHIAKDKISLNPGMDVKTILAKIKTKYQSENIIDIDGVKINFDNCWVHMRGSNTEPIIRIYSESKELLKSEELNQKFISEIKYIAGI